MAVGRRAAADHGDQPRHAGQAAPLHRAAAEKGLAGLGFGVGFDHKRIPKAIVDAAEAADLPLFEVPYEMQFIAITERAAARLVNEQFGVLERGVHVHERLERLVIEGHGLDQILSSTAGTIGGVALVLDRGGRELARSSSGDDALATAAGAAVAEEVANQAAGSTPAPFSPSAATSPAGRSRSRFPGIARRPRSPGWRSPPTAIRLATSSVSAPARRRSWSAWS